MTTGSSPAHMAFDSNLVPVNVYFAILAFKAAACFKSA